MEYDNVRSRNAEDVTYTLTAALMPNTEFKVEEMVYSGTLHSTARTRGHERASLPPRSRFCSLLMAVAGLGIDQADSAFLCAGYSAMVYDSDDTLIGMGNPTGDRRMILNRHGAHELAAACTVTSLLIRPRRAPP